MEGTTVPNATAAADVPAVLSTMQDDVLLRVTNTAICGSDLHLYLHGMPAMKSGDVLGHEFMGIVEEVGENVSNIKR
jgi:threonine dehydrogenase-like Zn-dependent dehydrogenase